MQAEAPSRPIARGLAGTRPAGARTRFQICHLPLYRQAEIYAREGVELERSTMADWVGRTSELLAPKRSVAEIRDERPQAARRRHTRSGIVARRWQDEIWPPVDLCT